MTGPLLGGYGAAFAIGGAVRDAIVTELRGINQSLPRVYVTTGAIAWDECATESCGQLVIGVTRSYLTDALPAEIAGAGYASGTQRAFEFSVQAIRCAPTIDTRGLAPSADVLEASAVQVLNDADAVYCATFNTLTTLETSGIIYEWLIRVQAFVGPEGACVGSELQFAATVAR